MATWTARRAARSYTVHRSPTSCAPLVQAGPVVEAARARLAVQAATLGAPCGPEAVLRLHCAGPASLLVPPQVRTVRLASLPASPAGDRRLLGAAISDLVLEGVSLGLDDARLARGFHPIEGTGPQRWRWTNGDGVLDIEPTGAARLLQVNVVSVVAAAAA